MLIYKVDTMIDIESNDLIENLKSVINNKFQNIITLNIELTPIGVLTDDNSHYFLVINCVFDSVTVTAEEQDLVKLDELIQLTFKSQYELSTLVRLIVK
jgi:hypothetical protein